MGRGRPGAGRRPGRSAHGRSWRAVLRRRCSDTAAPSRRWTSRDRESWSSPAVPTCTRGTGPHRRPCGAGRDHGGCSTVILTNAAGSLRPDVGVGRLVAISDQINLTGANPMCGAEPPDPMRPVRRPERPVQPTPAHARRQTTLPRSRRGSTPGCSAAASRHPPRSGCCRRWAPISSACPPCSRPSPPSTSDAEVFGVSLVTNLASGLQADLDHHEVLAAAECRPPLVGRPPALP